MTMTPAEVAAFLGCEVGKTVRPMGVPQLESARNRALAKGWHVDPDASPGHPHDGPCNCKAKKTTGFLNWCPCNCHGLGGPRAKE